MIPAGSGNTERHLQMINDYGTTVLIATPSYALHMCEVGEKKVLIGRQAPFVSDSSAANLAS